ncbi:MAG: helix-turn-helix domain-containing protein [Pasteurellaceae bacterium]|nr:helix-turn-helix domain-containing protein [Pasteurellaceae bacterium]
MSFYDDLVTSLTEVKEHLEGKRTLRTETLSKPEPITITAEEVRAIRERLNLSQAVFARKLRTSVRTYQGWEQGKTKPNPQAVLLLKMVEQSPQTFEQLASI